MRFQPGISSPVVGKKRLFPTAFDGESSTPLVFLEAGELVVLSSNGLEALAVKTGKSKWLIPGAQDLLIPVPVTDGKSTRSRFYFLPGKTPSALSIRTESTF